MKFFRCSCSCDGLGVEKTENELYLSFWTSQIRYLNNRLSWKERLFIVWRAVRGELPYTDSIILDEKESKKLAKYITKLVEGKNE